MRVTVAEMIVELQKLPPTAALQFQTRINNNNERVLRNSVQRIDNFGHTAVVVVEKSA